MFKLIEKWKPTVAYFLVCFFLFMLVFVIVAPFYRENICIPRASGMTAVMFMSIWKELWYDKKYGDKTIKNSWVGLLGGLVGAAFTFIL